MRKARPAAGLPAWVSRLVTCVVFAWVAGVMTYSVVRSLGSDEGGVDLVSLALASVLGLITVVAVVQGVRAVRSRPR